MAAQGGSEARHSNELLHHIISNAIDTVAPEVGSGLIGLVNSRDEIRDLLKLDDVIDLVSATASCSPAPADVVPRVVSLTSVASSVLLPGTCLCGISLASTLRTCVWAFLPC